MGVDIQSNSQRLTENFCLVSSSHIHQGLDYNCTDWHTTSTTRKFERYGRVCSTLETRSRYRHVVWFAIHLIVYRSEMNKVDADSTVLSPAVSLQDIITLLVPKRVHTSLYILYQCLILAFLQVGYPQHSARHVRSAPPKKRLSRKISWTKRTSQRCGSRRN